MEVGILGPLSVADGARAVEIGGARLRALLIRLAADAGGWVSVGELVEDLWESDPPGDEVNALQSLVSRLRRALPGLVESGPAGYRLAVAPEAVDAIRFERLAVRGRRELRDGHPEEAFVLLAEGLGLWRGAALVEVAEAGYAMTWAQRLEKVRLAAVDNRAAAGLQLGRHAELVVELEEVTEQHPLRERSHELLVRALAGSGRQAEALAVYERLSRRLASELGLDPPVHLQRLQTAVLRSNAEELVAADRGPSPSSPSSPESPPRTNLPTSLTSFIGREAEMTELRALIARSRLVTLVGPGGAGKTRLVSEAAARLREQGTDGVWMVELAPVTDPEDVASTVLGSIGALDLQILERSTSSPRDAHTRIVDTLSDHDIVLILDNCEHLLDAAAKLAEHLLSRCPQLKVLATSREPLGIIGETLWQVQPLPTPESGASEQVCLTADAVQLFIERASLVRPGFEVTSANLAAVVEICRRLDGLPLAIELAAARLRNLTVEAVAARLSDRFRLLAGGNRTAMPRHQTLRAVVAWSWDLLTESERRLAERLSVFSGGANAETAEAVCSWDVPEQDDAVSRDIVADLLTSLADKSLLVAVEPTDAHDGSQPRYRMLETIREFAAERLRERGETTAIRGAHARYFLDLVETAEPMLRSAEQLPWLSRLTVERDNLMAALRFAAEISDADTAIRIGAGLSWYWTLLGRHDEAANWLDQALRVPGERPTEAYAIAYSLYVVSAAISGFAVPDGDPVQRIQELMQGIDLRTSHPLLSLVEPGIAAFLDEPERAYALAERNLDHPDPWARAVVRLMTGALAENYGDPETMQRHLPMALEEFRKIGDRWGIGTAVGALATIYSARGDVPEAIEALQEAREILIQMRAPDDESYALARIAMMRLRLGDVSAARRDIEGALEIADRTGSARSRSYGTFGLAMVAHHEGRDDEAQRLGVEALAMIDRVPMAPPQATAGILCGLAMFAISSGFPEDARPRLVAAYEAVKLSRDMPVTATVATGLAALMLARGNPVAAARLLGAGDRLRGMEDLSDPDVLCVVEAARTELGLAEYTNHYTDGRNLTRDSALALIEAQL